MVVFFAIPHVRISGKPAFLLELPAARVHASSATRSCRPTRCCSCCCSRSVRDRDLPAHGALRPRLVRLGLSADGLPGVPLPADRAAGSRAAAAGRASSTAKALLAARAGSLKYADLRRAVAVPRAHLPGLLRGHRGAGAAGCSARRSSIRRAFLVMAITTIGIWYDFTYFREQTCLIACPYGRWQSVLLDRAVADRRLRLRARRAARQARGAPATGAPARRRLHRLQGLRDHLPHRHRHPQRPADGVRPLHAVHRRLRRDHGQGRQAARAHPLLVAGGAGRPAAAAAASARRCSTRWR